MEKPEPGAGDVDEAEKNIGGFVVMVHQSRAVLQLTDATLYQGRQGIDGHIDGLSDLGVLSHRYHRHCIMAP